MVTSSSSDMIAVANRVPGLTERDREACVGLIERNVSYALITLGMMVLGGGALDAAGLMTPAILAVAGGAGALSIASSTATATAAWFAVKRR